MKIKYRTAKHFLTDFYLQRKIILTRRASAYFIPMDLAVGVAGTYAGNLAKACENRKLMERCEGLSLRNVHRLSGSAIFQ